MTATRQAIGSTSSEFDDPARWAELDTPCTIIAGDVVGRNIRRMADYCRRHGIALRPHTKTHKSQRIAQLQLAAGAAGLTVAKPGEAHVMGELRAEVLIAYPSVTRASLEAVRACLAYANVIVALDSIEAATRLNDALAGADKRAGVLVDIDVGLHRTGLQSPEESARVAAHVTRSEQLRLDGLFCYPGHIWSPATEQANP
ncbi:MAG TPA: alanine racemase, partial [Lacipirellulaceae bacterium]|nr:alanine racemase [Lacipirellulaceae bacterium]